MNNSLLTFSEAKTSRLREVANTCSSTDDFKSLLNEAVERALNRGDWNGTVIPMAICVRSDCITWPRYVGRIRAMNVCGQPIRVQNNWYEFLQSPGFRRSNWWEGSRLRYADMEMGNAPAYAQISGENKKVRLYTFAQNDVGKLTKIFGTDQYGQPLQERDTDTGDWSEGVTLTAAIPFVSTAMDVRSISRVHRERTQLHQKLYAFDTVTSELHDLANYTPGETDPWYARSKIVGRCCQNSCDGVTSIVAEVKLNFVPIVGDDDLVLINNVPALKMWFQAIRYGEKGDVEKESIYEAKAIKELNMELNDANPPRTTPVAYEPFNGRSMPQQMI